MLPWTTTGRQTVFLLILIVFIFLWHSNQISIYDNITGISSKWKTKISVLFISLLKQINKTKNKKSDCCGDWSFKMSVHWRRNFISHYTVNFISFRFSIVPIFVREIVGQHIVLINEGKKQQTIVIVEVILNRWLTEHLSQLQMHFDLFWNLTIKRFSSNAYAVNQNVTITQYNLNDEIKYND